MKNKKLITEEDVQKALHKFEKDGGLIKHLPDQVNPRNTLVGAPVCRASHAWSGRPRR